jgi:hypothetical protein
MGYPETWYFLRVLYFPPWESVNELPLFFVVLVLRTLLFGEIGIHTYRIWGVLSE